MIFYLTFEYRISRHFRRFSFLLMIYFLGIGQDISYLCFLSFSNAMNLFSFKFQDKIGHIVWIFVFFLLVFFCSAGYFIAKIIYKKLSKYFIDDFFFKFQSFHILSCLSAKAFLIGSVNALIAEDYETLIIFLASIEIVYLIGVIYLQWKNRCYKIQTFIFLQILKSIVMAVFNFSLWVDWKIRELQQTEQQTKMLLDFNCKALIIVIIGLGALQAISTFFSGRKALKHRQKKFLNSKNLNLTFQNYRQKIECISLKGNIYGIADESSEKLFLFKQNAQKSWKDIKKPRNQDQVTLKKKKRNALTINQLDAQYQQNLEIIIIKGWNDT